MLTDEIIEQAEKRDKNYKLYDKNGLYILVTTKGSKIWRYKYRFNQAEQTLSLNKYPEVTIDEARKRVKEAREYLRQGHDPREIKKVKNAMTLSTPVKILRKEIGHLEDLKERLNARKLDIQNQLDDITYDLNEVTNTLDELRGSIKYLEEAFKR